jgi:hypothetical protein
MLEFEWEKSANNKRSNHRVREGNSKGIKCSTRQSRE